MILAWIKSWICKFTVIIEYCHDCGIRQPLVWWAPDEMWSEVTGEASGGGILCPSCFDKRASKKGIFLRWTPRTEANE